MEACSSTNAPTSRVTRASWSNIAYDQVKNAALYASMHENNTVLHVCADLQGFGMGALGGIHAKILFEGKQVAMAFRQRFSMAFRLSMPLRGSALMTGTCSAYQPFLVSACACLFHTCKTLPELCNVFRCPLPAAPTYLRLDIVLNLLTADCAYTQTCYHSSVSQTCLEVHTSIPCMEASCANDECNRCF